MLWLLSSLGFLKREIEDLRLGDLVSWISNKLAVRILQEDQFLQLPLLQGFRDPFQPKAALQRLLSLPVVQEDACWSLLQNAYESLSLYAAMTRVIEVCVWLVELDRTEAQRWASLAIADESAVVLKDDPIVDVVVEDSTRRLHGVSFVPTN